MNQKSAERQMTVKVKKKRTHSKWNLKWNEKEKKVEDDYSMENTRLITEIVLGMQYIGGAHKFRLENEQRKQVVKGRIPRWRANCGENRKPGKAIGCEP
ncbi:hypothetical protein WR25_11673 [Diploscapter pachys]|uniref:Uncharacterized protein n=1 Tax=Diploscapter pachys TaxID=2018661 RepID=A0A2A2LAS8_9BILA|nr:hypothetical protein WR25_11673 [Diploscapter pachys]